MSVLIMTLGHRHRTKTYRRESPPTVKIAANAPSENTNGLGWPLRPRTATLGQAMRHRDLLLFKCFS